MGPLTLYDVVGIDTAYFAGQVMHEAFPDRDRRVDLAVGAWSRPVAWVRRSGVGFFSYKDARKARGSPTRRLADGRRSAVA